MTNKTSRLLLSTAGALAALVIAIVSCNKKFDAPPAYVPPNIKTTITINDLKIKHVSGQVDSITTDDVIGGVVIANDSSGNFYKQIILQDSTGGIAVNIDDYNLYATFPIGRKVYVKVKGLFMSEDAGLLYLGGSPAADGTVGGIASRLKDQYIVKAETGVPVTPTVVTISDLKNNPTKYMYTLVQFNNFEVKNGDTSKTYAYSTPTTKVDANIIVKGCGSSDTMIIRTSAYSNFANVFVPKGNGTLTAVYAYYKSPYNGRITPQVIIRDTSDVQFKGSRCDGTVVTPPPSNATLISIKSLRALYKTGGVVLGSYKIGGVVISDVTNKNISAGSVILQDGDRGVSVYFGGTLTYALNDSVVVDVTGDSLISYKGSLEVKTARGATVPAPVASNKTVTPADLSISQLNGSLSDIEYTLIRIHSATATGAGTFSGNQTLTDASGNTALYTAPGATFASTSLPSGANDWVGYGSFFNSTPQFQIRNTTDISGATGGGTTNPPPTSGSDITLATSPYAIDFNSIGGGLPTGVYVQTAAKATAAGTPATFTTAPALWKSTTGGFKNFASATGLNQGSDSSTQMAAANRALGVRQTSSTDPGIAFAFALNNTTGKSNLGMSFNLQSLDTSSPRTTTWIVDYAIGDTPTSFTQASTGTITTGNHIFSNTPITVNFGSALDNQSGKVWIRVTTLAASTGSGNRASTAVDDVSISFQ